MLEMRNLCERCGVSVAEESVVYICSHECTFCTACTLQLEGVCPNCSGELLQRPRRIPKHAQSSARERWTAELSGSCHCGAVQFELARTPESVTECNCSICRRYGARWAYFERATARVMHAPGALSRYSWSDREIEFCHCSHCGCMTHYESVEMAAGSRVAVNTRMLEPAAIVDIPVKYFDGAVSWTYLEQ